MELQDAVELAKTKELTKLEKQVAIQGFEYTHQLAWNVLKDYLEEQGHVGLVGSKDTTREAFKRGLVENGETWMDMIKSRNLTSHAYEQLLADNILDDILNKFYTEFTSFKKNFTELYELEK